MPSIRETYFACIPFMCKSKHINDQIIKRLIMHFNGFNDETELTKHYDDDMNDFENFAVAFKEIMDGKMFEYVTHESIFDKNKFYVDENVLIPRQETEELLVKFVEKMSIYGIPKDCAIADVCTGSGCIGLSLAKRFPNAKIYLTDISEEALKIANKNKKNLDVKCQILSGNMIDPLIEKEVKFDCLICNPPYIQDPKTIDKRTWEQEPHLALLADPDTKYYEEIFKKVKKVLNERFLLGFEIGEDMKCKLSALVKKYFPDCEYSFENDMDGKSRFLFINRKKEYINAESALLDHGVISFPTETVMGLGIIYDDLTAFERLNRIKRRPENKPYSLMLSSVKEIKKYAEISEEEMKVAKAFLPGPLTLLLKKKLLPKWVTLDSEYVGIRIPDIPTLREVIKNIGKPILAPSANRSGEAPALTRREVKRIFKNEIDFLMPGNALNSEPSTIVLINNGVKIVREGPIKKEQIEEVLKHENRRRK